MVAVGDVRTWDFQSDIWEGRYEVIEHVGGRKWRIKTLPDLPEVTAAILADTGYCGGQVEVDRRAGYVGEKSVVEFVSSAEWHAYF